MKGKVLKPQPCKRCAGTGHEPRTGGTQPGFFGHPPIKLVPEQCRRCKGRKTQR